MKSCSICVHFGDKTACPLLKNLSAGQEGQEFFGVCSYFEKYYRPIFDMRLTLKQLNSLYTFKAPTDTKELLLKKEHVYIDADPIVHAFLEAKYREIIKAHDIEEVIRHLQRGNYIEREEINRFTNKIPIKNGLFNFSTKCVLTDICCFSKRL